MTRPLLALAVAFSLASCSTGAPRQAAEDGVARFHQAMDAGRIGEIYDGAGRDVKSGASREHFIKLFSAIRARLGPYRSGETVGWDVNLGTDGQRVTLNRKAQFAGGPATEEFVFDIEDGKAVLAGYHVSADALVVD